MKHFFSTRIRVVLVVTLLLAGILAVVGNLTGLGFPSMVVKGILTPLRTGVSSLTVSKPACVKAAITSSMFWIRLLPGSSSDMVVL